MSHGLLAYLLWQIPGQLLAGVVVWLLFKWGWLSPAWALGLVLLWVAKDLALYPFVRGTFRLSRVGAESLVGARGTVQVALAPRGQVHVAGELWRAQSVAPGEPVAAGTRVVVRGVRGLTLLVEDERAPASAAGEATGP